LQMGVSEGELRVRVSTVREALARAAEVLEEHKGELNELDAAIGDGDHGRTVSRAFGGMAEELEELAREAEDVGSLLKSVGRQIVFSSGAATGPLYGTAFMEAGEALGGEELVDLEGLADAFAAAEEGIKERGGGEVGEKTMLDTIDAAREALREALEGELSPGQALEETVAAARRGRDSTEEMVSKRGRSSRLGERTVGHIDPGAASAYLVIEAMLSPCAE